MGLRSLRFLAFLPGAFGLSPFGAPVAPAATSRASAATLEQALQAEFDAAGAAMHEELAHQAQGDFLGAAVAEKAMQVHRARYLDLRREAERRSGAAAAEVGEGAIRNPFAPDPAWTAGAPVNPSARVDDAPARRPVRTQSARWDLYRGRDEAEEGSRNGGSNEPTDRAAHAQPPARWGMYGGATPEAPKAAGPSVPAVDQASEPAPQETSDREPPTRPFLVYRDPQGSDSAKRDAGRDP